MREKYLLYVKTESMITTLFSNYVLDHDLSIVTENGTRLAINAFSDAIKNYLIDRYNLDANIEEDINE